MSSAASLTDALTQAVTLQPGRLPGLLSPRQALAPRLVEGRDAQQVPALLAAVFSLCGGAHRWAAQQALAAAAGAAPLLTTVEDQQMLAQACAREHLLRMAHDWPRLMASQGADRSPGPLLALADCPLWQLERWGAQLWPALQDWLAQRFLGQSVASWWAGWCEGGAEFVRAGLGRCSTVLATGLAPVAAEPLAHQPWAPGHSLGAPDTRMARALGEAALAQPDFCLAPHWQGQVADMGPWHRGGWAASTGSAWAYLCARLAELVALSLPALAASAAGPALGWARLQHGRLNLGPGVGMAWTEMSRGVLMHVVESDRASGRVRRYRVLAPTEWNLHPQGRLAQALAGLHAEADTAQRVARIWAAALDPCVPCTVQPGMSRVEPRLEANVRGHHA